jgi:DNA-binding NtrC family response regulator
LDEIGELSSELQAKLMEFLSTQEDSLGGLRRRIVCATTKDLRQEVDRGKFRKDLFYRLSVVTFDVPPLRRRLQDLATIADYFREQYGRSLATFTRPFSKRVLERMHHYEWPGNIRELEGFVCRYVIFGNGDRSSEGLQQKLSDADISALLVPGAQLLEQVRKHTMDEIERRMIIRALEQNGGSTKKAALSLGIAYRTLLNKMDRSGLPRNRNKSKLKNSRSVRPGLIDQGEHSETSLNGTAASDSAPGRPGEN